MMTMDGGEGSWGERKGVGRGGEGQFERTPPSISMLTHTTIKSTTQQTTWRDDWVLLNPYPWQGCVGGMVPLARLCGRGGVVLAH
jgi:hypothetical protein